MEITDLVETSDIVK